MKLQLRASKKSFTNIWNLQSWNFQCQRPEWHGIHVPTCHRCCDWHYHLHHLFKLKLNCALPYVVNSPIPRGWVSWKGGVNVVHFSQSGRQRFWGRFLRNIMLFIDVIRTCSASCPAARGMVGSTCLVVLVYRICDTTRADNVKYCACPDDCRTGWNLMPHALKAEFPIRLIWPIQQLASLENVHRSRTREKNVVFEGFYFFIVVIDLHHSR